MPAVLTAEPFDAVVIGAGFGGLGAALRLAEGGARVCLLESLRYPGGSASTFSRGGYRFEAGATLFSGFGEGQLFRALIDRHALAVTVDFLDPVVTLRAPSLTLPISSQPGRLEAQLAELPGAPVAGLRRFFALQRRVADVLWEVLDDPALLPPFRPAMLLRHLGRSPRYLPLLPLLGRPLGEVLVEHGLADWQPLRLFLDGLCQITIQCSAAEAETPFALATMDYFVRGTGHVRGGIGVLAEALVGAVARGGGDVRLASAAKSVRAEGDGYRVETRRGPVRAPVVIANLLPQSLAALLGEPVGGSLAALAASVESGWGACMLYLGARVPAGEDGPRHVEIVQDPTRPFVDGNHLFCSVSGPEDGPRAPAGERTITVSTHVAMGPFRALSPEDQAARVAAIQETMRAGLRRHLGDWYAGVTHELTASPRTFERFTGRHLGLVGGVPRRAGLHNYRRLGTTEVRRGLFLVGDSVFPGQSTLATTLSGIKAAERVLGRRG